MTKSLTILLVLALATFARADDAVRLRHLAVVELDAPITLGMIADLSGDAAALADLVVIESPHTQTADGASSTRVDIQTIRKLLRESGRCDFSVILLKGSSCEIRPAGLPPRIEGRAAPSKPAPVLASTYPVTTLKGQIAAAVARSLDAPLHDIRLSFDPRDARLLATSIIGRTVDASLTGRSDEAPVRITIYERDRILLSETVRVTVSVRRDVCILKSSKRRDEAIGRGDFAVERQWLRALDEPIAAADAVGLVARSAMRAGKPLLKAHAEEPVIVERGDIVTVHCVNAGVILQMPARAKEDGRDGEVIEFEHLRGGGVFLARMSGKGRAVVTDAKDLP